MKTVKRYFIFGFKGIHAIVKNNGSNKLYHRVFNISTGSVEIDSKFPTETAAFMGLNPSKNIQFYRLVFWMA